MKTGIVTHARAERAGGHNEDSRGDHVGIATHALRVRAV